MSAICLYCQKPSPCGWVHRLEVIEPKRVACGEGFVLAYPAAYRIVTQRLKATRDH